MHMCKRIRSSLGAVTAAKEPICVGMVMTHYCRQAKPLSRARATRASPGLRRATFRLARRCDNGPRTNPQGAMESWKS